MDWSRVPLAGLPRGGSAPGLEIERVGPQRIGKGSLSDAAGVEGEEYARPTARGNGGREMRNDSYLQPVSYLVVGAAATVALLLLIEAGYASVRVLGALSIGMGLWAYYRHGKQSVDTLSIWALACILFVGVALLVMPIDVVEVVDTVPEAAAISLGLQLVVTAAIASAIPVAPRSGAPRTPRRFESRPWEMKSSTLLMLGAASYLLGRAFSFVSALSNFGSGFIWVSFLLGSLGAASAQRPIPAVLVPVGLYAHHLSSWAGSGRLNELSSMLGMLLIYQLRRPPRTRRLKSVIPLLLVPGLLLSAIIEANRLNPQTPLLAAPSDFSAAESVYSVWSPMYVFSWILDHWSIGDLEMHGFHTFFVSAVVWLPRALWAEKPVGWGRELAWIFNPQAAANSGHSEAGLLPGEFVWGFGLAGVLLCLLFTALLATWIHVHVEGCRRLESQAGRGDLRCVVWGLLAAAMPTLLWTGSFEYAARTVLPLLALLPVTAVIRLRAAAVPSGLTPTVVGMRD